MAFFDKSHVIRALHKLYLPYISFNHDLVFVPICLFLDHFDSVRSISIKSSRGTKI